VSEPHKISAALRTALDEHRRAWHAAGGRWSAAVGVANNRLSEAHRLFYEAHGFWWTGGNVALLTFLDKQAADQPLNRNMNRTGKSHE
jgi:hypothetical protein